MILLLIFSFMAGIVTILSPCILPILPIILGGSLTGGKQKPLGIVAGFIGSFTFFTLFLSILVQALNISADALRFFSIIVIFGFGVSLITPKVQLFIEQLFSRLSNKFSPKSQNKEGFFGGVLIGLSLGLLWTPCVGPILASVISLALTGSVNSSAFFITLAYAVGTAIPMLLIIYTGRSIFQKIPSLLANTANIQKVFGVVMMLTAIGIFFNVDRKFQTFVLQTFPQYGTGLTKFEDNEVIQEQLQELRGDEDTLFNELESGENSPQAPELIQGGQWFNLPNGESNDESLQLSELQGKVVLVDFWTYSCINCIRTLPYLKAWHDKYKDQGLVIIGVHAPEFEFEKNPFNVQQAINDFAITYPIMQDNDFKTWRAYENKYWPAKYLVDKDGKIRYTHFGEGKYEETERMIQELLKETGQNVNQTLTEQDYTIRSRTPEIYFGYDRMEYLSSPERVRNNIFTKFTHPTILPENSFSFAGDWKVNQEFSQPKQNSELKLQFESKDVYMLLNPTTDQTSTVLVELNGKKITPEQSGKDVTDGVLNVNQDRLYHLIELAEPGKHTVRLLFSDGNVEVYTFTFG